MPQSLRRTRSVSGDAAPLFDDDDDDACRGSWRARRAARGRASCRQVEQTYRVRGPWREATSRFSRRAEGRIFGWCGWEGLWWSRG